MRSGAGAGGWRWLAAAALAVAAPAFAKPAIPKSPVSGPTAAELEQRLARERALSAQLGVKATSLLGRLAELERQIEVGGRALRAAQARLRVSQARLSGAEQKSRAADDEVNAATDRLGPRLTARYRLGREGYLRFLLGARSIAEVLRRKRLYTALLESDFASLDELRFTAMGAKAARDQLTAARDELSQSAATEQEKRAALEVRVSAQRRTLASVQQEKATHDQAVRELEQAERELAARLKELQQPGGAAVTAGNATNSSNGATSGATNTADNHGDNAAGNAANNAAGNVADNAAGNVADNAAGDTAANGTAAGAPGASAPGAAGGLGAGGVIVASVSPGLTEPAIRSVRGKLLFPVEVGRVEARFGRAVDPRFGTVTLQKGLDVRAPEGTPVHVVHGGKVVHSGWFRGYGNLVIVDHGGGFFSLYAHLASLDRSVGEELSRGESVGTVGDTGSLKGAYLYFELRDGQKPLDPERWLSRTRKPGPLLVNKTVKK